MSIKSGILTKATLALSLALSISAVHAADPAISDASLAANVKSAVHGHFIRVQAIDGTVYLYGTVDTYPERVDVEEAAKAAAQGHRIVDSIEFSPS